MAEPDSRMKKIMKWIGIALFILSIIFVISKVVLSDSQFEIKTSVEVDNSNTKTINTDNSERFHNAASGVEVKDNTIRGDINIFMNSETDSNNDINSRALLLTEKLGSALNDKKYQTACSIDVKCTNGTNDVKKLEQTELKRDIHILDPWIPENAPIGTICIEETIHEKNDNNEHPVHFIWHVEFGTKENSNELEMKGWYCEKSEKEPHGDTTKNHKFCGNTNFYCVKNNT